MGADGPELEACAKCGCRFFVLSDIRAHAAPRQIGLRTYHLVLSISCSLRSNSDRDCARWKLSPAEVQKRRALFWELFITDCWQALATGRLSTFALPFVDTELAGDPDETMAEDGTPQPSCKYSNLNCAIRAYSELCPPLVSSGVESTLGQRMRCGSSAGYANLAPAEIYSHP